MKGFIAFTVLFFSLYSGVFADSGSPVSYYLSFENPDFLSDDWIEQTGLKTLEERKWEFVDARFGKGLYLGAVPLKYDNDNMSGLDLDLVTAVIFNVGFVKMKGRGYDEPFIWGAGKIHPGSGAVSFWVKGSSIPETSDAKTVLFEQTTSSWGRKERQLMEVELYSDGTISAYVEDARYVQHTVQTGKVWKNNKWNHIVFMWDRSSGISLCVNGKEAASSMGTDAWWENQRPGLFHFPMAKAVYDEFYSFTRPLSPREIKDLYRKNRPPKNSATGKALDSQAVARLKKAFCSDTASLPAIRPYQGSALVFTEITPLRIHDEGIQGWWISDGRYELAWPHEISVFTIIPGDVDFHAEKVDLLPPPGTEVNYITFEGNLDGVKVLKGDREGNFENSAVLTVPDEDGFFYGTSVFGLDDAELRIPFTKSYGTPPGFKSDGDVLRLPLSGDLRLHEVGLFNVTERYFPEQPGDRTMYVNKKPPVLDDSRYPAALKALFCQRDRNVAGLYHTFDTSSPAVIDIEPMTRLHLISESAAGKLAFNTVTVDMWVTSPGDGNVLQFRLYDPAVPSHTWTHAEVELNGFTGEPSRLKLALVFDPAFLVSGDRLWLELLTTDGLSIITGDADHPSKITITPETDWIEAEQKFSLKTMRPNIMIYGRSFEYIPWEWDKRLPDIDAPENFGGMFDMAYPWQAVLKVNPGDRLANIYKAYATGKYRRGRRPSDIASIPDKIIPAPANAPKWAVYFRELQTFRGKIVTWWRHHQRSDGQVGGGWNDDTLIFSRALADMPLDSNPDALILYNKVFDGFDKTNYFKDGYCRIYPIDRLHNGDFVRERYKSLVYNLGNPKSATWAMEEAWHWGKPEKTPINYGNGRAFLFGKDVLEWYWGKRSIDEPYKFENVEELTESLRNAVKACNYITLWRFTEAWVHTDDQSNPGSGLMLGMLLGGWNSGSRTENTNVNITVGVNWIKGGGPQLARLVKYSGNDGFKAAMYSFDAFDREVVARLLRLVPGQYSVSLKSDNDGDGTYETVVSESEMEFRRFGRLSFKVPPQQPVELEVKQIKAAPSPGDLPDLAISNNSVKKSGNSLVVTVHNIGCARSGPFTVTVVCPHGNKIGTAQVESLSGAADFVPKKTDVIFTDLPYFTKYLIQVDTDNKIMEIFEENNEVEFITGDL